MVQDPKEYITSIYNWLEASGNVLVILVQIAKIKSLSWVMILLVLLKAVLTLKVFKAQRTLIQMILQCMIAMIPFLTIVGLTVFTFALVNFSIDKDSNKSSSFFANFMLQYRILYGENTEIDFNV